jgi:hypothetical protein
VGSRPRTTPSQSRAVIAAVKTVHTAVFFAVASSIGYLVWSGATGRTDRRAVLAGAIVAGESLVFAGNGWRCPLTDVAERFGAESGSVTDIYLPPWVASHIPHVSVPAVTLGGFLHARNLVRARPQRTESPSGTAHAPHMR